MVGTLITTSSPPGWLPKNALLTELCAGSRSLELPLPHGKKLNSALAAVALAAGPTAVAHPDPRPTIRELRPRFLRPTSRAVRDSADRRQSD